MMGGGRVAQLFLSSADKRRMIAVSVVACATILTFFPILGHLYIELDDPVFITENLHIRNGVSIDFIRWAFTTTNYEGNWIPLTWIAHALIVQLFGVNPAAHHGASLLLHTLNGIFLFLLLERMTGSAAKSLVVALLFAIHPLHVQSVAWGAELKDLLSTFFMFCAIAAYIHYRQTPSPIRYGMLILAHLAGVCSKSMVVTLPVLLLLFDWWPLRCTGLIPLRIRLLEKTPLILLSLGAGIMTLVGHRSIGAIVEEHSLPERFARSVIAYGQYLGKLVYPADIAVFYPFDPDPPSILLFMGALILIVGLSIFVFSARDGKPYLVTGWLWYLVSLAPVIGIIQIGDHSIADRYTYIPSIGFFVMIVWWGADLAASSGKLPVMVAIITLVLLGGVTVREVSYWKDSLTLFDRALTVTGQRNWLVQNNYGELLLKRGDVDGALERFRLAVDAKPDAVIPLVNYAAMLALKGRFAESHHMVSRALRLDPLNQKALTLASQLPPEVSAPSHPKAP
ncbi:MAG: tetratricopeptide repeat protein [Desulfuromonadia bacterium]